MGRYLVSDVTVYATGDRRWRNAAGKLHRLDGPAVEHASGSTEWYADGKPHRLDGPADEWPDGSKTWWVNGNVHRLDGPAVEHASGTTEWWVSGNQHFNFKDYQEASGLPDDQITILILKYGGIT